MRTTKCLAWDAIRRKNTSPQTFAARFFFLLFLFSLSQPLSTLAHAASGNLDLSFGSEGMVSIDFGGGEGEVNAMALQADGKILLVGSGRPNANSLVNFALMRLTPDGQLDRTFGDNGTVSTRFTEYFGSVAKAVKILSDQKILVVGTARNLEYAHDTFALARYHSNGILDTTFGENGLLLTAIHPQTGAGINDIAHAVDVAPDGRIVVAGVTGTFLADFAIARYHRAGFLDTSFGDNGILITDIGGEDSANAVVVQSDNKIVVAGNGWFIGGSNEDFTLVRYNVDGSLDESFGYGGVVTTDFMGGDDRAQGVALLSDGRIVAAGVGQVSGGCFPNPCERYGMAMAQYNSDGSLDFTFGNGGGVIYDLLASSGIYALAPLADGRFVLGGHYGNDDFLVSILHANGAFDESFGGTGAVLVGFGPGADRVNTILVQPDGKILAAGRAETKSFQSNFAVVRLE